MGIISIAYSIFTKIAVALITVLVGFMIAKLAGKIMKRVLVEAELNRILKAAGFRPLSDTLGSILEYVIYTITLLIVLQQFGLTKIILGIVAVVATIIIAFSIFLTIRDFIPNALIGLLMRKKMKRFLGKKVKIGINTGKLEQVGIVASVIRNKDEYYIPHMYTSKHKIKLLRAS